MLETVHLTKIYQQKKGAPVKALDDVSLRLPDTGMVFLLGKSGSGKSTMLNLLGGLDTATGGDILIKGKSAASFKAQDLDSYRNTYVGFIFQEYNLLDEFSVGANIALALELQGQKATDEAIDSILNEVDLAGYGSRHPKQLSGGQKQRVAIARALVKNPEIIMADEPTGALDSNTGRQVFDTLKKLSEHKLVLVVSHDREFAEHYADRIIELADGRVISDLTYENKAGTGISITGRDVSVSPGYHLTAEDVENINRYIDALQSGTTLHLDSAITAAHPTDTSDLPKEDGSKFAPIRSKLPMRYAFRTGATGLKHKKFRLVITILLCCVAFGLFGLSDTLGSYDNIETTARSIVDTGVSYAAFDKEQKYVVDRENDITYYSRNDALRFSEKDMAKIEQDTGIAVKGVFRPRNGSMAFDEFYDNEAKFTDTDYHIFAPNFSGYCEIGQSDIDALGYTVLAGKLPDGKKDELAISKYVFETFKIGGYSLTGKKPFEKISAPADMVGKMLDIGGTAFTVSAVIDTGMDIDRYRPLTVQPTVPKTTAEDLLDMALMSELNSLTSYSLHQLAMVGEGRLDRMIAAEPISHMIDRGYLNFIRNNEDEPYIGIYAEYILPFNEAPKDLITFFDPAKTALADNEVIVSSDLLLQNDENFKLDRPLALTGDKGIDGESESDEFPVSVVGVIDTETHPKYVGTVITSASLADGLYTVSDGAFSHVVGSMPDDKNDVKALVTYCSDEQSDVVYRLRNSVTFELDSINEIFEVLAKVFLYVGLFFALFAALMLANFISTSIAYKKREIGILRAVGSRSQDVFRIFFSESFIIAMINFVISAVGVGVATLIINTAIRMRLGILITVLSFSVRQVLLLFAISCLIAAVASFIPVYRIARKKPVEAILGL